MAPRDGHKFHDGKALLDPWRGHSRRPYSDDCVSVGDEGYESRGMDDTDKIPELRYNGDASIHEPSPQCEDRVRSLEHELEETRSQLATTQSQLATTRSQLTTTRSQLTTTRSQLATTRSQLTTTRSQSATAQSQLATTRSQLATAQSQLGMAQRHNADLELRVGVLSVDLSASEHQVSTHLNNNENLNNELQGVRTQLGERRIEARKLRAQHEMVTALLICTWMMFTNSEALRQESEANLETTTIELSRVEWQLESLLTTQVSPGPEPHEPMEPDPHGPVPAGVSPPKRHGDRAHRRGNSHASSQKNIYSYEELKTLNEEANHPTYNFMLRGMNGVRRKKGPSTRKERSSRGKVH